MLPEHIGLLILQCGSHDLSRHDWDKDGKLDGTDATTIYLQGKLLKLCIGGGVTDVSHEGPKLTDGDDAIIVLIEQVELLLELIQLLKS